MFSEHVFVCVCYCMHASSPSSAQCFILVFVFAEEAEKGSGVTHSTLSHSMALWWKRSLLQAEPLQLMCGSELTFDC